MIKEEKSERLTERPIVTESDVRLVAQERIRIKRYIRKTANEWELTPVKLLIAMPWFNALPTEQLKKFKEAITKMGK